MQCMLGYEGDPIEDGTVELQVSWGALTDAFIAVECAAFHLGGHYIMCSICGQEGRMTNPAFVRPNVLDRSVKRNMTG